MDTIRSALLTSQNVVNRLLPFTSPSTPLYQDRAHTLLLCTLLYFAPRILERPLERHFEQQRNAQQSQQHEVLDPPAALAAAPAEDVAANEPWQDDDAAQHDRDDPLDTPPALFAPNDADAGPGPAAPAPTPRHRNVGAKKAKSLARKDQRRAYHEFLRNQSEQARAMDESTAAERAAAEEAERRRRAGVEARLEENRRREREGRKEEERREREREGRVREGVVRMVREGLGERGVVELEEVARRVGRREDALLDADGVEKLVRLAGIVGGDGMKREGGVVTMVTGGGWVVRVEESDMAEVYRRVVQETEGLGRVGFGQMGGMLEEVLMAKAAG